MNLYRQLALGYLSLLLMIIVITSMDFYMATKLKSNSGWIAHTHEAIAKTNKIEKLLIDLETGGRGFVITGKDSLLEPYYNALLKIEGQIESLKLFVSDNPKQVVKIELLHNQVKTWLETIAKPEIEGRRQVDKGEIMFFELSQIVEKGTGTLLMDNIRNNLNEVVLEERRLLVEREQTSQSVTSQITLFDALALVIGFIVVAFSMIFLFRKIHEQIGGDPAAIAAITKRIAGGDLNVEFGKDLSGESGILGTIKYMVKSLQINDEEVKRDDWLKTGLVNLNETLRGDPDLQRLGTKIIKEITKYLGAQIGTFYTLNNESELILMGSYAFKKRKNLSDRFKLGEGLIGQAALEKQQILLSNVPEEYIKISSSIGDTTPRLIAVTPIVDQNNVLQGVIEIASINEITDLHLDYLEQAISIISLALTSATSRARTKQLLEESQQQANILRETEERTLLMFNSTVNSMITINNKGIIESFNTAASKLFGYQAEEIIGKNVKTLMPSPYHDEHDGYLKNYSDTGTKKVIGMGREVTAMRKDKSVFPAQLSVGEMQIGGKKYYIGSLLDISDQKRADEQIQQQNEELRSANEELEQKTDYLQRQKDEIQKQNKEIDDARISLHTKAEELSISSKYKSEFLANMSHELRTPLNSLLILSKSLAGNREGNLTDEQVESAATIHSGGKELLELINDILDLSKVEAGKLKIQVDNVYLDELITAMKVKFENLAEEKGLDLKMEITSGLVDSIETDIQRIHQILKNLISNAVKFTQKGSVILRIDNPAPGTQFQDSKLTINNSLALSVIDTGIGIATDKQNAIFEAFQQADGATNRKFGGTGLGLTISRELARLLGGEIHMPSIVDEGSTFTLYLPKRLRKTEPQTDTNLSNRDHEQAPLINNDIAQDDFDFLEDDRKRIDKGDKSLLIIEDDIKFSKILLQMARDKGFKCLATFNGAEGLALAQEYQPSGVLLDLGLPDIDGVTVLDRLKNNLSTRHIPVHILSAREARHSMLQAGAVNFLLKPVTGADIESSLQKVEQLRANPIKKVLVIEDEAIQRQEIVSLIKSELVEVEEAENGTAAEQLLQNVTYDCMILDIELSDMTGFELLQRLENTSIQLPPVIVHTGRELSEDEHTKLTNYAERIVIKGSDSPGRLLDEVSLFLHSLTANLTSEQQAMISIMHDSDQTLKDKKILLVDDDVRNTFALSKELRNYEMQVILADNGELALEKLESEPDIDLVLMDIMMPVMDGYEAMKQIRQQSCFEHLPIIAITALAMPEDRAKCIDAGANDYLFKPLDMGKLLSMMRIWLFTQQSEDRRSIGRPWSIANVDENTQSDPISNANSKKDTAS